MGLILKQYIDDNSSVRILITISLIIVISILYIRDKTVPPELLSFGALIIGYYFGNNTAKSVVTTTE